MTNPVDLPQHAPAPTLPAIGSASFPRDVQDFFAWQVAAETGANVAGLAQSAATNAKSAQESAIAAQAASAGIDVPTWEPNENYHVGRGVKSPAAIAAGASPIYICKVAISGSATDPYNDPAHWSIFNVSGGVGGAVYTTSTALTASSPFSISISGGAGVWLKLPDATTLSTGIRHTVRNVGDNDLTLIDASGAHIGFVRPQSGATIALSDNSTAAGKWAGDWEMYGITADLSLNLSIASSNIFSTAVKIDNNKTMFLYGQIGGGLYAVVYDTSTQTATDSLLVRASFNHCMAVLIGGNVGIMTCDSSTALQIALISPACALVSTATATASGTVNGFWQIVALGSGYVTSYSTSAPTGIVRAISVSGTTLTFGSEVSFASVEAPRLYVNGNYLMAVRHNNSGAIYCTPYTLSGNTLTAGTAANTPAGTYYSDSVRTFQLDNGDIVANHICNGALVCSIFRLNGSVQSVNSINLFSWSSGSTSFNYFSHVKMPDGRVCFGGIYNGSDLISVYMTNTSGVPSISSTISIRASNSLVRSNNFGFTVNSTGFTFDFTKNSPVLSSVGFCQNIGNLSSTWMDRLSRFNASIAANSSSLFAFGGYGDTVTLFGKTIIDSPQKMRITIPVQPSSRGESRESIICSTSITTNGYGFRIVRIKCVD